MFLRNSVSFPAETLPVGSRVKVTLANGLYCTGTLTHPYDPSHALRLDIDDGEPDKYLYDQVQRVEAI